MPNAGFEQERRRRNPKVPLFVYQRERKGSRMCFHCAKWKKLTEYGWDGHGNRRGICLLCMRAYRHKHEIHKRSLPGKMPKTQVCNKCKKLLPACCFPRREEFDKKIDGLCMWCGSRPRYRRYARLHTERYAEARQSRIINPEKARLTDARHKLRQKGQGLIIAERKQLSLRRARHEARLVGSANPVKMGLSSTESQSSDSAGAHISTTQQRVRGSFPNHAIFSKRRR